MKRSEGKRKKSKKHTPKLLGLPPPLKPSQTKNNREQIITRQEKVLEMRLEGKTYDTISRELGISRMTAYHDSKEIAKMKYQGLIEKDESLIMETNAHIDAVIESQIGFALDKNLKVGTIKTNSKGEEKYIELPAWESAGAATDRLLKALELRAKINGFYTPRTAEPKGDAGSISANLLQIIYQGVQQKPLQATVVEGELVDG